MPRPASHRLCLLTPLGAKLGVRGRAHDALRDREEVTVCGLPS